MNSRAPSPHVHNPYRPLFLIGILAALVGAGLWIPYGFNLLSFYPGRMHAHIMMGIFLPAFASGFLMTAIPKMTQTFPAKRWELYLQMGALGVATASSFSGEENASFFVSILISLLLLTVFAIRRLRVRRNDLPEVFPFVQVGLLSGLVGSGLWLAGFQDLGHRLFYLNFILCLVLGVGSRLIPALLRLNAPTRMPSRLEVYFYALLVTGACFIESSPWSSAGPWLRAAAVVGIAIRNWRLLEKSAFGSGISWGVRLSASSVVLGNLLYAADSTHPFEWLHLIYVSGFGLLSFMIASRVSLAHGGHDLALELKNWHIKIPIGLILLSAATRALAPFWPDDYQRHLAYASLCFVSAVIVWAAFFVPKILNEAPASDQYFQMAGGNGRRT